MLAYFIKATYTNSIYKISDFYVGSSFKLNPDKSLDILLEATDGRVITKPTTGVLPDETTIRDYTHIIIPSQSKVYRINRFIYININQTRMELEEDAIMSHYNELINADVMLTRANDMDVFTGVNDIRDLAIKHTANVYQTQATNNDTGAWIMMTFQDDAPDVEFEFQPITLDTVPTVPEREFSTLSALNAAYPPITNIKDPWECNYYLKFAYVTSESTFYQATKQAGHIYWRKIKEDAAYTSRWEYREGTTPMNVEVVENKRLLKDAKKVVNTGDINSFSVAFPLDATLTHEFTFGPTSTTPRYVRIPTYYELKSFNRPSMVTSIKIIPGTLIDQQIATSKNEQLVEKLTLNTESSSDPATYDVELTSTLYPVKSFYAPNLYLSGKKAINAISSYMQFPEVPVANIYAFKTLFNFTSTLNYITDYEPFSKYFLYFFGELVAIPARYITNFNIRLAITSTDIIFEVYTDNFNVIASGRLQWFTRYSVDQLKLFEANNPTYKEQYWTNQLSGAIRSIGTGAIGGAVAGSAVPGFGTAAGAIGGAAGAAFKTAVTFTTNAINHNWMIKGLKDQADQIFGENDVSMTLLKGFSATIIKVEPESLVWQQMIETYNLTGFPVATIKKISDLTFQGNLTFGSSKVIAGNLIRVVKNQFVTDDINDKLNLGIVLVP